MELKKQQLTDGNIYQLRMLMLGSKGSGKTHIASKFGKPYGSVNPPNFYEKQVYIGNKIVNILIQDPLVTIDQQLATNSYFNNLAAAIFVFNPYEDQDKSQLNDWNNLLSHNIRNPHVSVTVVANCYNMQQRDPQETQGTSDWAQTYNGQVVEIYDSNSEEEIQSIFLGAARQVCQYIDEIKWGQELHDRPGGLEKYGIKISRDPEGKKPIPEENKKGKETSTIAQRKTEQGENKSSNVTCTERCIIF